MTERKETLNTQGEGQTSKVDEKSKERAEELRATMEEVENLINDGVIQIKDLANAIWLEPEEKTLPNKKVVQQINWKPENLEEVFNLVNKAYQQAWLGNKDNVTIDGASPSWVLACISHAFHPVYTSVSYPQWGEWATIPLSGVKENWEWYAEGVEFKVEESENETVVSFELEGSQVDLERAIQTLEAPEVTNWKPVLITWRGPISIPTSLAESYAHSVPYVGLYQPWVWYVVAISHDADNPLGTVIYDERESE